LRFIFSSKLLSCTRNRVPFQASGANRLPASALGRFSRTPDGVGNAAIIPSAQVAKEISYLGYEAGSKGLRAVFAGLKGTKGLADEPMTG
jgi:hypothetical protein